MLLIGIVEKFSDEVLYEIVRGVAIGSLRVPEGVAVAIGPANSKAIKRLTSKQFGRSNFLRSWGFCLLRFLDKKTPHFQFETFEFILVETSFLRGVGF